MIEKITHLAHNLPTIADPFLKGFLGQHKDSASCPDYYKFLYGLVMLCRPKIALELGVQAGLASAHMASAALEHGGHVIGVDHHLHHVPEQQLGGIYRNFSFIAGDTTAESTIALVKHYTELYGPIGVVFQDSSHHYNASIAEWEAYTPMMEKGAVWVCHDILPVFHDPKVDPPGTSMVTYFDALPGTKIKFPKILDIGSTIGVVVL